MSSARFRLPESVRCYLSDPAVSTGVDALLDIGLATLPDGLEWHELADYLAARAAAELTRSEWASMVHGLWIEAWSRIEGEGWQPASTQDLVADEYAVTPETCWNEGRFARWHTRRNLILYTAVRVTRSSTQIAFSLETTGGKVLLKVDDDDFAWIKDGNWEGWLVAKLRCSPAAPEFDLNDLRTLAERAAARVREAAPR